jgi:hypothetical protein
MACQHSLQGPRYAFAYPPTFVLRRLVEAIRDLREETGKGGSQLTKTAYRAEGKELLCAVRGRDVSGVLKQLASQIPQGFWIRGAFLDCYLGEDPG